LEETFLILRKVLEKKSRYAGSFSSSDAKLEEKGEISEKLEHASQKKSKKKEEERVAVTNCLPLHLARELVREMSGEKKP